MKYLIALMSLIILNSFIAKASLAGCHKQLKNKRIEMNLISMNIANLNTTRTPEGGPYQKQELKCLNDNCEIMKSKNFLIKYEPGHPDADDIGYVKYPDIVLMDEMSNLINATRDYEEVLASCK